MTTIPSGAANATERAVRGQTRTHKLTAIYRASERGESSHIWRKQAEILREASTARATPDQGHAELKRTREDVVAGWRDVGIKLRTSGDPELADDIRAFVDDMPPVQTERAMLVESLRSSTKRPAMTPEHVP